MEKRSISTNAMDWLDSSSARPDIYFASLEGIIEASLLFVVSLAVFICVSNKKVGFSILFSASG
jgi:hypothetical protein